MITIEACLTIVLKKEMKTQDISSDGNDPSYCPDDENESDTLCCESSD